ncbi:MAG: 2Fe-2S iron-sulfur cluster-binding protein [Xanthomonadales bacterium]|nr:2Fe-2S iron-sulfur cluster-binding protein [Xanthomonadales bacterium]
MMQLLKKLHKWVGLLIGIQVILWLLSGLVISLLDPVKVSGRQWVNTTGTSPQIIVPVALLEPAELPAEYVKGALGIDLTIRRGKPAYLIRRTGGETLVNGVDGSLITTGKADAEQLALQDFSGDGEVISVEQGMAPDMETRDHTGAYWRINFADKANTAIYIAASTGRILERRNSYWRVRDFFWMLHIMDYPGRQNFNHPLIITVVLIAIWLGISGFLLLFGSFNRHDFFFLRIPGKRDDVVIILIDPMAGDPRPVVLRKGSNLFLSLATHGVSLPSLCGGGGECGKCRVRFEVTGLPETKDLDLRLVPKRLREKGYRLACQHIAGNNITLYLPEGTLAPLK